MVSLVFLSLLTTMALPWPAVGQSPRTGWSLATNLSQSGSASQPAIVLGPEGTSYAFWWDHFDGLMTAHFAEEAWQPAAAAGLMIPDASTGAVPGDTRPIDVMPQLLSDGQAWLHAFWLVERGGFASGDSPVPEEPSLAHAQRQIGSESWSAPTLIASGVLEWQTFTDPEGVVHLAYVRSQHTEEAPAGIYYIRMEAGGAGWGGARLVHSNIYARLLTQDELPLAGIIDGNGTIVLASRDPRLSQASYYRSEDTGETWSETLMPIADADQPQMAVLADGRFLSLWQVALSNAQVAYYQQISEDGGISWSIPVRVLREAARAGKQFTIKVGGPGEFLFVAGAGEPSLALAIRQNGLPPIGLSADSWSVPRNVALNIYDSVTERTVSMEALELATGGQWLTLVGLGQDGEIWALRREAASIDWMFAADSPWSDPEPVWQGDTEAAFPTVLIDSTGRLHTWWIAADSATASGASLWYAYRDGGGWVPATSLFALPEQAQALTAVASGERVYLVWTDGRIGAIQYTSAFHDRAATPSEWNRIRNLALPAGASGALLPKVEADIEGGLHLLYAVPLNEGRGIYYMRSDGRDETWSAPLLVFDAASAGWSSVGDADLAIGADGTLHAVWTQMSLAGESGMGVYWSSSADGGATWSLPSSGLEGPVSHPRVVLPSPDVIQLFWIEEEGTRSWSYRYSVDGGETWTQGEPVPGLTNLYGEPSLAYDGIEGVHLLGIRAEQGRDWGVTSAVWTPQDETWSERGDLEVGTLYRPGQGVVAVLSPVGGQLHALIHTEANDADGGVALLYASRSIPVSEGVAGIAPPPLTAMTVPAMLEESSTQPQLPPEQAVQAAQRSQAGAGGIQFGPFWVPLIGIAGIGVAGVMVLAVVLLHIGWPVRLARRKVGS